MTRSECVPNESDSDACDRDDGAAGRGRGLLSWLRARTQVIVVSDTYVEFARPLIEKLGWPTLSAIT